MLAGEGGGDTAGTEGAVLAGGALGGEGAFAGRGAMLTLRSWKPASWSMRLALPNGCPRKLGMTYDGGSAAAVTKRLVFGAAT